jgi:predicted ATP-grasp superfamily ATP-dependent carboligase
MECVIVGGNHFNTLWLARSLGKEHIFPDIIILNPSKKTSFVTKTKYANRTFVVNSKEELIELLISNFFREKTVLISAGDDVASTIDVNYNKLKTKFFLPNCNQQQGKLVEAMDKKNMNDIADEVGFNIPLTIQYDFSFDNSLDYENIIYPCIVKPGKSISGHKEDFRICQNKKALIKELTSIKSTCSEVLIQEYIEPEFEFLVNCVRLPNGENIVPGVIRKEMKGTKLNDLGMTFIARTDGDIDKYIDKSIIDKFICQYNYHGIYSIEFMYAKNKAYFLELNLRSDATMFISTTNGVNLPLSWYNSFKNDNNMSQSKNKYSENITFGMAEVSYFKTKPFFNPFKMIRTINRMNCFSIFSWSDIKPFIYKFIYAI